MKESLRKSIALKKSQATNILAFFIFGLFAIIMVTIGLKVLLSSSISDGDGKEWYSLFKNGFIVISNLLTVLVGYYFGFRTGDAALEKASDLYTETEQIVKNVEILSPTTEEDMSDIRAIDPEIIEEVE